MTNTVFTYLAVIFLLGWVHICNAQVIKPKAEKLSVRQRLARNGTIQKHLTWEENNLLGRVKNVTIREYAKSVAQKAPEIKSWEEKEFNPDGFLVKTTEFAPDGNANRISFTMYDRSMNDTAEYTYSLPDHNLVFRIVFKKDARGNETRVITYNNGYEQNEIPAVYKYDKEDNLVEINVYSESGGLSARTIFSYDRSGFKTGGVTYDSAGNFKGEYVCKFDEHGNFLHSRTTDTLGKTTNLDSAFYDGNGCKTKTVKYGYRNNLPRYKLLSELDAHHNPTAILYYESDGRMIESRSVFYENNYDATGNIVHKKSFHKTGGKKVLDGYSEFIYAYY